jgi:two-component system LytT family response regulator
MITAIIVDDETKGAKTLHLLLQKYCPQIKVIGLYESVAAAKEIVIKENPHLVFLDIEMPFENGFRLLEQTKQLQYEVIFTTAYNHYAINAIKANALDYLLKPIDIDDLVESVKKAEQKIFKNDFKKVTDIESIMLKLMEVQNKKLALSSQEGIMLVELTDIEYFEADSNYTYVYLTSKKKITVSKTLKIYEKLVEGISFMRVHNSFIVNFKHIEKYIKGDGGTLIMKSGNQIPVSRAYKQELLNKFEVEVY